MKNLNWHNVETNFTENTVHSPRLNRQFSPSLKTENVLRIYNVTSILTTVQTPTKFSIDRSGSKELSTIQPSSRESLAKTAKFVKRYEQLCEEIYPDGNTFSKSSKGFYKDQTIGENNDTIPIQQKLKSYKISYLTNNRKTSERVDFGGMDLDKANLRSKLQDLQKSSVIFRQKCHKGSLPPKKELPISFSTISIYIN